VENQMTPKEYDPVEKQTMSNGLVDIRGLGDEGEHAVEGEGVEEPHGTRTQQRPCEDPPRMGGGGGGGGGWGGGRGGRGWAVLHEPRGFAAWGAQHGYWCCVETWQKKGTKEGNR
jgi:hypothetical protein